MSHKSSKIKALVSEFEGHALDPRYLGYFACFNRQEFYLAHDVLEDFWLEKRGTPEADFYKALIQLAGAFVHLQKERLAPAGALFRLCKGYFARFPSTYQGLDVTQIMVWADRWIELLEQGRYRINPLLSVASPQIYPRDIGIASIRSSR